MNLILWLALLYGTIHEYPPKTTNQTTHRMALIIDPCQWTFLKYAINLWSILGSFIILNWGFSSIDPITNNNHPSTQPWTDDQWIINYQSAPPRTPCGGCPQSWLIVNSSNHHWLAIKPTGSMLVDITTMVATGILGIPLLNGFLL